MRHFDSINIETSSMCNRVCPTCIRNSNPDKEATKSWFEYHLMPMEVIEEIFRQYIDMGFKPIVCLCNYNEPLMDPRIVEIAKLAKSYNIQPRVSRLSLTKESVEAMKFSGENWVGESVGSN